MEHKEIKAIVALCFVFKQSAESFEFFFGKGWDTIQISHIFRNQINLIRAIVSGL